MQVENYARAFPDMHRELYQLYVSGNIVVVQLALQGRHLGPLHLPAGTLPPTGTRPRNGLGTTEKLDRSSHSELNSLERTSPSGEGRRPVRP